MKIYQIIKRMNNTELGKGATHDNYVFITPKINPEIIFNNNQEQIEFTEKRNPKSRIKVEYKRGRREQRFNKLGEFQRNNNLNAGDEILFERKVTENGDEYYIDYFKYNHIVVMKKTAGFIPLNNDINLINNKLYNDKIITIEKGEYKKERKDSPEKTQFYNILFNGENQLKKYKNGEMLQFKNINQNDVELRKITPIVVYEMEVSE